MNTLQIEVMHRLDFPFVHSYFTKDSLVQLHTQFFADYSYKLVKMSIFILLLIYNLHTKIWVASTAPTAPKYILKKRICRFVNF